MQTNNKSYYLFQVNGLPERYRNTREYVMKTLVPRTSNQTTYEVLRGTNSNVYLYIKVADIDLKTVRNYINTNKFLQRIQNEASAAANYQSIVKKEWQTFTGTQQKQNKNNQNNFMNQNNIFQGFNNQVHNKKAVMHGFNKNAMNQGFNNQFGNQQFNNNNIFPNPQFVPQFNNNKISNQQFVAQQQKAKAKLQQQQNELKNLDPNSCATQHIFDFFNKETILKKMKKNQQTIHALNPNKLKVYLDWLSKYIHNMYDIINKCALEADNKRRCWETNNQQITFNKETTKALLDKFARNKFLNDRNPGIDGSGLIKDINEIMKELAECSLKIYNGQINVGDAYKIMTVYDDLLSCLNQNAKAFVDKGFLGLGLARDNGFRKVMNEHAKVQNLKDVILGLIGLK